MTQFDAKTTRGLYTEQIMDVWRAHCASEPGQLHLNSLLPCETEGERLIRAHRMAEARALYVAGNAPSLGALVSVEQIGSALRAGKLVAAEELLTVATVCQSIQALHKHLTEKNEDAPLLAAEANRLPDLSYLADTIGHAIDPAGQIFDDATPNLKALRRSERSLHKQLRRRTEQLVHGVESNESLQDDYYTLRNDRYVLPVRAEARSQVRGIIHGRSGTGQTVYIEPEELIEPNNQLNLVRVQIAQEETAILRELAHVVDDQFESLTLGIQIAGEMDCWFAGGRFAEAWNLVPAATGTHPGDIHLKEAQNPILMLQKKPVVANDIDYPEDHSWLVISGVNAGGKSVTLNPIGTMAWMHAFGLPLPVGEGSILPLFPMVSAIIGDQQNIHQDLSTFTGHIERIRTLCEDLVSGSLVLIDEIMDGTDPDQGAALAQAVIETLKEKGLVGAVTTHFPQLKVFGQTQVGIANARVVFDTGENRPTYGLEIGNPADSEPFLIARNANLDPTIIDRALDIMGPDWKAAEQLKIKLAAREKSLVAREREMEASETKIEELRREIQEQKDLLNSQAHSFVRQAASRTLQRLDSAFDDVRTVVRELQSQPDSSKAETARKKLIAVRADVEKIVTNQKEETSEEAGLVRMPTPLQSGMHVHVKTLGRDGTIESIQDDQVQVLVGSLRLKTSPDDLYRPASTPTAAKQTGSVGADLAGSPLRQTEIDLRGHSVEEALESLSRCMDQCLLAGQKELLVIHGHGTNRLKKAIRDHLSKTTYIDSFAAEDEKNGGDGVTHIWFERTTVAEPE